MSLMDDRAAAAYRNQLVQHNQDLTTVLSATRPAIAAFLQRHFELHLYPLEFTQRWIKDLEALCSQETAVVNALQEKYNDLRCALSSIRDFSGAVIDDGEPTVTGADGV